MQNRRTDLSETLARLEDAQETLRRLQLENRDQTDIQEIEKAQNRYSGLRQLEDRAEAAGKELELRDFKLKQAEDEGEKNAIG